MADIFPLQQDVNRKAGLHVYFRPQVAKSRNGVSIIWRAGRPSGWALPRILVLCNLSHTKNPDDDDDDDDDDITMFCQSKRIVVIFVKLPTSTK